MTLYEASRMLTTKESKEEKGKKAYKKLREMCKRRAIVVEKRA